MAGSCDQMADGAAFKTHLSALISEVRVNRILKIAPQRFFPKRGREGEVDVLTKAGDVPFILRVEKADSFLGW